MATMTPFAGLRASSCSTKPRVSAAAPSTRAAGPIKASFKDDLGVVVAAAAASTMLVGNAMAIEVLPGGDGGSDFKVSAGEKMRLKNNAGTFPLINVVLDEGAGVDVAKISTPEEEYLTAGGETYLLRLNHCAPHQQGADMEDAKQIHRKLLARLMKPW